VNVKVAFAPTPFAVHPSAPYPNLAGNVMRLLPPTFIPFKPSCHPFRGSSLPNLYSKPSPDNTLSKTFLSSNWPT